MDVKMGYSGELTGNGQITTVRSYYKGLILMSAAATISNVTIHDCSAAGTPSAANMVAELGLPAVDGDCIVDNPTGVIECPDGIRAVVVEGTVKFHVRYSVMPG